MAEEEAEAAEEVMRLKVRQMSLLVRASYFNFVLLIVLRVGQLYACL